MSRVAASRFPFGVPNSWFHVAWSDELAREQVRPLHRFGRDLALYRDAQGRARVLDAHCAHLGADLSRGGRVVGDAIQCPFHGWCFDGEGACVRVPYARKIPPRARVRAWPVDEVSGRIFVWHHAEGAPPGFRVPEIPGYGSEEWTSSYEKYRWTVKTHPQEIMENAIDWSHFTTVHGMDVPRERSHRFDGPMFHWNIGTRKDVSTMGGVSDSLFMEAQNWGLGFNFLTYTGMFTTIVTAGLTPIDEETTDFAVGIIGRKDGRSDAETRELLKSYMDDQSLAIEQDFRIWENKRFRIRPMLCDGDGPIGEFRRWVRQFYSDAWWERSDAPAAS